MQTILIHDMSNSPIFSDEGKATIRMIKVDAVEIDDSVYGPNSVLVEVEGKACLRVFSVRTGFDEVNEDTYGTNSTNIDVNGETAQRVTVKDS